MGYAVNPARRDPFAVVAQIALLLVSEPGFGPLTAAKARRSDPAPRLFPQKGSVGDNDRAALGEHLDRRQR
jgi:hypothetical protein